MSLDLGTSQPIVHADTTFIFGLKLQKDGKWKALVNGMELSIVYFILNVVYSMACTPSSISLPSFTTSADRTPPYSLVRQ
jgi:hypothetical protein